MVHVIKTSCSSDAVEAVTHSSRSDLVFTKVLLSCALVLKRLLGQLDWISHLLSTGSHIFDSAWVRVHGDFDVKDKMFWKSTEVVRTKGIISTELTAGIQDVEVGSSVLPNLCSASLMFVPTAALFASNSVRCARARTKNASHSLACTSNGVNFTSLARFIAARRVSTSGPSTPCKAARADSNLATRSCAVVTFTDGSANGRVPDVFATGAFGFGWRGTLASAGRGEVCDTRGHWTDFGRGLRMSWIHPFGTSNWLHPLRTMNGPACEDAKEDTDRKKPFFFRVKDKEHSVTQLH